MKVNRIQPRLFLAALAVAVIVGLASWMSPAGKAQSNKQNADNNQQRNVRSEIREAESLGQVEDEASFDLIVSLKMQNREDLDRLITELHDPSSTHYHEWLTPEQFGERFGPSASDYEQVADWLTARGFEITKRWPSRLQINF